MGLEPPGRCPWRRDRTLLRRAHPGFGESTDTVESDLGVLVNMRDKLPHASGLLSPTDFDLRDLARTPAVPSGIASPQAPAKGRSDLRWQQSQRVVLIEEPPC